MIRAALAMIAWRLFLVVSSERSEEIIYYFFSPSWGLLGSLFAAFSLAQYVLLKDWAEPEQSFGSNS